MSYDDAAFQCLDDSDLPMNIGLLSRAMLNMLFPQETCYEPIWLFESVKSDDLPKGSCLSLE